MIEKNKNIKKLINISLSFYSPKLNNLKSVIIILKSFTIILTYFLADKQNHWFFKDVINK